LCNGLVKNRALSLIFFPTTFFDFVQLFVYNRSRESFA